MLYWSTGGELDNMDIWKAGPSQVTQVRPAAATKKVGLAQLQNHVLPLTKHSKHKKA